MALQALSCGVQSAEVNLRASQRVAYALSQCWEAHKPAGSQGLDLCKALQWLL